MDSEAIKTAASELPDVLLLSPSRRGLNKASTVFWGFSSTAPILLEHVRFALLRDCLQSSIRIFLVQEIRRWVAAAAPRRIVYIAHEQQAFLRDAKALATVG